ncbi:MAG: hypothetical protein HY691_06950 [Chloroflexi bacterium]|nr:hypothetical protein [Chloroflexota bacterium]
MTDFAPRIKLPPVEKASPEELARRRKVVDELLGLRQKIGPIGTSTNDLLEDNGEEEPLND